jgi:hypothetical protein
MIFRPMFQYCVRGRLYSDENPPSGLGQPEKKLILQLAF